MTKVQRSELARHGLKPQAKLNLFSTKLILSGICHSSGKEKERQQVTSEGSTTSYQYLRMGTKPVTHRPLETCQIQTVGTIATPKDISKRQASFSFRLLHLPEQRVSLPLSSEKEQRQGKWRLIAYWHAWRERMYLMEISIHPSSWGMKPMLFSKSLNKKLWQIHSACWGKKGWRHPNLLISQVER